VPKPTAKDIARYKSNWVGEINGASLYESLSRAEKNRELSKVYAKLAEAEKKHARFWEAKIKEAGHSLPPPKIHFRTRFLSFLAAKFGPRFVLPTVMSMEQKDRNAYDDQPEAKGTSLPSDEHSHLKMLEAITQGAKHGIEGGVLARLEGRHRVMGGNALRAAVLGANDGLLSNLSLIMGVAGAEFSEKTILITGFAGLVAGACSMAMGEWLSVQSSRELYTRQIKVEKEELREMPLEEQEELALIYEAKGLPKEEAEKLASKIMKDETVALNTLSREELGIDPENLGGSAWVAAFTSFALFCAGAIIPIVPFFFLGGSHAVFGSILFSAAALFLVGALITLLTGRSALFSGARQLLIGLAAAGVTYGIGKLIGAHLGS